MWGSWITVTIASLKAAFYGIGNGGAGQVHPYNEKMVLLKPALREIFRVARYMRCLSSMLLVRHVDLRLRKIRIIFVNAFP
jgi:hypothetical protein